MTRYPTPQVRLAERQPPAAQPAKSQGLSSLGRRPAQRSYPARI